MTTRQVPPSGAPGEPPLGWAPRLGDATIRGYAAGEAWLWSATAHGGPTMVSPAAVALLDGCDGARPWEEAAHRGGVSRERAAAIICHLVAHGLVTPWPGGEPRVPPRPRRLSVWWHLTNRCTLACPHCYMRATGGEMTDAVADRMVDLLATTCARRSIAEVELKLAGGEPFMRTRWLRRQAPRWRGRLEAVGATLRFVFLTNGTRLDREAVALIQDLGASVSLSLDGLGELHDRMRPTPDGKPSYPRVEEGIARLLDAEIRPYILTTLTSANAPGLGALGERLIDLGLAFRVSLHRELHDGGHPAPADASSAHELSSHLGVLDAALDDLFHRVAARLPVARPFLATHRLCDLSLLRPIRRACGAGETHVAVGHDGRVAACQAALAEAGREPRPGEDLLDAASDPRLRRDDPGAECRACPFHAACAGGCPLLLAQRCGKAARAGGGQANGASPYCELFTRWIPRLVELGAVDTIRRRSRASTGPWRAGATR